MSNITEHIFQYGKINSLYEVHYCKICGTPVRDPKSTRHITSKNHLYHYEKKLYLEGYEPILKRKNEIFRVKVNVKNKK